MTAALPCPPTGLPEASAPEPPGGFSLPPPARPVPAVQCRAAQPASRHRAAVHHAVVLDEGGELVRTLTFEDFATVSGRTVPKVMHMTPADKPAERTTVRYLSLEFGVPLEPSFFSLQSLKSRK